MFECYLQSKMICKAGAFHQIYDMLACYGSRVLVVVSRTAAQSDPLREHVRQFSIRKGYSILALDNFDGVVAPFGVINDGIEHARFSYCDLVVGIGDAPICATARLIACLASHEKTVQDLISARLSESVVRDVSYVEIPTSPCLFQGLSTEIFLYDSARSSFKILKDARHVAKAIILDPLIFADALKLQSQDLLSLCVFEAAAIAIDSSIADHATPFSHALATRALELVLKLVLENPKGIQSADEAFHSTLCTATLLSSAAASLNPSAGLAFSLSSVITSLVPHASHKSLYVALFYRALEFGWNAHPDLYKDIFRPLNPLIEAESLKGDDLLPPNLILHLIRRLNLDAHLSTGHIDKGVFYDVVRDISDYSPFQTFPGQPGKNDILGILEKSWTVPPGTP